LQWLAAPSSPEFNRRAAITRRFPATGDIAVARGRSEYWSDPPVSIAYRALFLIRSKVYQSVKAALAAVILRARALARLARDRERRSRASQHHIGVDARCRRRPPGRA